MAVLRIAAGDAFMDSAASTTLDIMDLLPRGFQPRCPMSSQVDVAPIPERFQDFLEEAVDKKTGSKDLLDAAGLLSQDFLQYLHTRFLGPRGTSEEAKSKHPLWERIASAIEASLAFETVKLEGLSATLLEAIREFTTAINNLWEGSIYKKLLDYILRVLLRLHLAPIREQKTRDLRKKKALEKQRTIEKRRAVEEGSRAHHKQWFRKKIDLLDQLSDVVESATEEVVRRRVPMLLSLLQEHQRLEPERREQSRLPSIEEGLKSAADSQNKDVIPPVLVDHEQATQPGPTPSLEAEQGAAEDGEYDSDDEDKDSVFGDETGATILESRGDSEITPGTQALSSLRDTTRNEYYSASDRNVVKEPTRARLKSLQAVLSTLLETSNEDETLDRQLVKRRAYRGSNFTDAECDVVVQLARLLRPYVPKRRPSKDGSKTQAAIAHVALRAPLILIANAVLRITGYAEFTRRLSPQVSVGAHHALAMGAVGLYEVLCGSNGAFMVKDRHGDPITNRAQITADPENKNAVFGAFFDRTRVDKICKDHGLEFRHRIVYVDRRTVRIVERVIPHGARRQGHPVVSRLEKRKKDRRGKTSSNIKWVQALAALDLDKKAVAEKAEDAKNIKEELEREIKAPRAQMRSLRASQTLA
ncbi:hypothetical protein EC968_009406 [Mortierella alpina]|nr:hypothetical protein EC968_009406 [Mortierella alpina]